MHLLRKECSRGLLCKKFHLLTAKVITHALSEFLSGQQPDRLNNGALAVDPLWFNLVEPGALGGQSAWNDAHTSFPHLGFAERRLIVLTQPDSDLFAHPAWEALSQMSTNTCLPCAWTCSHNHCKKSIVTWLTGRPDTKRRCM